MSVVRFPPSPTGPLHLGGARTALYNYLYAKKTGGRLVFRLEDTDQTRFVAAAEDHILDSLAWCGITFDEGVREGGANGPYRQSERADLYQKYARQLIDGGFVYEAFDTPEELDAMRQRLEAEGASVRTYNHLTRGSMRNSLSLPAEEVERLKASGAPSVLRFKMPANEEVVFQDVIRGEVSVNTGDLDDKILLKSDGLPTYHLANVIDDHHMEVTQVMRGEEWLSSVPLHILLYRAFGWKPPQWVHIPLILKPEGKGKLSKRDGAKFGFPVFPVEWTDPATGETYAGYREAGYEPEAFVNALALLGWNPGDEEEIMSVDRLAERFSLERVNKSGARFDPDKFKWFNEQYLRAKAPAELRPRVADQLRAEGLPVPADTSLDTIIGLMQERVSFTRDIVDEGRYFFEAPTTYNEKMVRKQWKENTPEILTDLRTLWKQLSVWNETDLRQAGNDLLAARELGRGRLLAPLRLALTGVGGGPDVFAIAAALGREESIRRLDLAMERLG